jgi:hypothetical protein
MTCVRASSQSPLCRTRAGQLARAALVACVATLEACGGGGSGSGTPVQPPGTAARPVVTAPSYATAGHGGYVASVPAQAGASYAWTITGGVISAGSGTEAVTFSADASGTVELSCAVTTASGATSPAGTASVTIVPPPATPVVTAPDAVTVGDGAASASVDAQAGVTYAWTITGGVITAGASERTVFFRATDGSAVLLACTVTNAAGDAARSADARVSVVSAPPAVVVSAPALVTADQAGYGASVPAVAGATYAWTITGGTITAGATTSAVTFTAGPSGTVTVSCVVTNAAGSASAPGSATATVVSAPGTPAVSAPAFVTASQGGYTASVPAVAGASYAWTISGGTLTAGAGTSAVVFTAGPGGSVDLGCTVTNAAGTAGAAGTASAVVVAAPATPVVVAPAYLTAGQAGATASVAAQPGASYAWSITGGTITAGALTRSVTFTAGGVGTLTLTCVVTNQAGASASSAPGSTAVVALPGDVAVVAPTFVTAGQGGYGASVLVQGGSTYAWTIAGGTITAGAGTPSVTFTPGASGSVTLSCTVTNAAGAASIPGTAVSTIVPSPAVPSIAGLPSYVTARQFGYGATVTAQPGTTYHWTVTGGTIDGSADSSSVSFTSGDAPGTVTLYCVATNAAGTSSAAGWASASVVAAPVAPVVTAPGTVTAGQGGYGASVAVQQGVTYAWTISGGQITSAADSNAITFTAGASGTVSLTCVVTNRAGSFVSGGATATIVPIETPIVTVAKKVTANQAGYTASVSPQAGVTYTWTIAGGTITAGDGTNAITFTAGSSGTVDLTCEVRNAANDTAVGSASALVVPAPVTPSVAAAAFVTASRPGYAASVASQPGSSYAWTIAGGAITAGDGTTAVTFTPGASGSVTLGCTVTNAAGTSSAPGQATATVVPMPAVTAFTASPETTHAGASVTLTATFTGGTGAIDQGVGPVTSGAPATASPSSSTVYTLTVTNAASSFVTAQVRVLVGGQLSLVAGVPSGAGNVDGTGAGARFYKPAGVATDAAGNIYVADTSNSTIRKIASDGSVTTLAGAAGLPGAADGSLTAARFHDPYGVAVDGAGNVYVADTTSSTVRKIANGQVTTLAGKAGVSGSTDATGAAARFYYPRSLAVDAAGNVYVADTWNDTIRKIDPTGVVTTLAGMPGDPGVFVVDGTGSGARFNFPNGIALGPDGNLYVADNGNLAIRMVVPDTGVVTTLATGVPVNGVAVDAAGNVYAPCTDDTVRKITPQGDVTVLAGTPSQVGSADGVGPDARFTAPTGMALDAGGSLIVADTANNTIRRVTRTGGVTTTIAGAGGAYGFVDGSGAAARFQDPYGVVVDAAGNAYVADFGNQTVRKIAPSGLVVTLAGTPQQHGSADGTGAAALFNGPRGVAVDGAGNVYVSDAFNYTVRKITPAGAVTTLAGKAGQSGSANGLGSTARFGGPWGVAADADGNVYVGDAYGRTVRKITPDGTVSTLAGSPGDVGSTDGNGANARFMFPTGVAVDASGNVFVADQQSVRKVTPQGDVTTLLTTASDWFYGIAVDPTGAVFVSAPSSSKVIVIAPSGTVSTVVGVANQAGTFLGPLPASLFSPNALAIDPTSGNLLIALPDAILQAAF